MSTASMTEVSEKSHYDLLTYELANRTLAMIIVETGILVVFALTASFGNIGVFYVFYKTPRLRSGANFYIIALACSNGAYGLIVSPTAIATSACGRDIVGHDAGQVMGFLFTGIILSSLYITSLIALNRFVCVNKPLIYKTIFRSFKAVLKTIVIPWIASLSILATIVFTHLGEFMFYPGRLVYLLAFKNHLIERISRAAFQIVFIIIPMIITIICSVNVYYALKRLNASYGCSRAEIHRNANSRKEVDISKSLLLLVMGFIVCWIPSTTIFHIAAYRNLSRKVEMFSICSVFISTAINPLLLSISNKGFRRAAISLLRKRSSKANISSKMNICYKIKVTPLSI